MAFLTHRLENGLEIIGEPMPTARSVAVGFFVKTGARDEMPSESGVSHFLEHMVFKGTPKRSAQDVNRDFDRIGASHNAYTNEELTVFHAAMLPEYLHTATDILIDILRPSLRQEDFNTEKEVILEEIGMYQDMPGFAASEQARKIYYGTHPLGQSILGSTDSIRELSRDAMQEYFDRRYTAANITIAIAGLFDWSRFIDQIVSSCGHWSSASAPRTNLTRAHGCGGSHVIVKPGVAQEHVLAISPGPAAEDDDRYAAATLAIAIGDDTGSRYYWQLIHEGRVESASCGIDQNMVSGVIASSFSGEPGLAKENLNIIRETLRDVQNRGITAEELATAKSKIASRLVRHSEKPSGRMRAIAAAWIYNHEHPDLDTELARFDAVSLDDIRNMLDRYPLTNCTVIGYGPATALE